MNEIENIPKISIGLPVYNGEKFIRNRLDNILSQTFSNFELIISDNASTDSTTEICKEYAEKDSRIKYIRQSENIGAYHNARFVLLKAQFKYFVLAFVDDIWDKTFIEKNIRNLEINNNAVGSTGRSSGYGENLVRIHIESTDNILIKLYKKTRMYFRNSSSIQAIGSYDDRIRIFLKIFSSRSMTGVFRTEEFKKSFSNVNVPINDFVILLNVLKYGEIHVIDEELIRINVDGMSSKGMIHTWRSSNISLIKSVFPYFFFTVWFIKNLGIGLFLKNIDVFLRINILEECYGLLYESKLRLKSKMNKNE